MDSIFFVLLRMRSVLHSWYKTLCTCMLAVIITPFTLSAGATRTTGKNRRVAIPVDYRFFEMGQKLERRETEVPPYPPSTFAELRRHVKHQGTSSPQPVTWFTNNDPIMVDARKDVKTLTWPAHPFDSINYKLNTTAYFNIVKVRDQPLTYKFYTPAFEQYAVAGPQKYVLAVVEQGTGSGSYGVKFVNDTSGVESATSSIHTEIILENYSPKAAEATVEGATSTCTEIILEDYTPKVGDAEPDKKSVSMHVINNNKKVYLSPGKSSTSKNFVTTSPNPASFVIIFYSSTI